MTEIRAKTGDASVAFRRRLHQHPELSGQETATADLVAEHLRTHGADVHCGLGGHGVLGLFHADDDGPTILLRCELDALPIDEPTELRHASRKRGVSHKCGHDGHMAILEGVAARLGRAPIARGTAALLFQPAEETGEGAAAVLGDPEWKLNPDRCYALHNVPGRPLGTVLLREGVFALASRGLEVRWHGRESHAGHPQHGISPLDACLTTALRWSQRASEDPRSEGEVLTIVHAGVGNPSAFGTAPGRALLQATLRSSSDEAVDALERELRGMIASAGGLEVEVAIREPFPASVNDAGATATVRRAAGSRAVPVEELAQPFAWSEDFGHFLQATPGCLFGLGSGVEHAALHDPDYDFPDELLPVGVDVFDAILREHLGKLTAL